MSTGVVWLDRWISSGSAIDWILGAMVIEVVALIAWRAFTGRGLPAMQVFCAVGAGAGLFLALRFALTDPAQTGPIALCLVLALAAHLVDLRSRWGRH